MDFLTSVNWITVLIVGVFVIPILSGLIRPFSFDRMQRSLSTFFSYLELILTILLSIFFTKRMLTHENNFLTFLYRYIPQVQSFILSKSIWTYLLFILIFMLAITGVLQILKIPVFRYVIVPLSIKLSSVIQSTNSILKRVIGGLWQIPKSICLVLILSLFISYYSSLASGSFLSEYLDKSSTFQAINHKFISPLLSVDYKKKLPAIFNDVSFNQAARGLTDQVYKALVINYFNGTTMEEAVKSNAEIDMEAKKIVGSENNEKEKAKLIYQWISETIKYDNNKLIAIATDSKKVSSGAIEAFNTRSGVCFDYACLYVAMCHAAGVKVRIVTGLAYSGTDWGNHAWNQVYCASVEKWLNVDTTFGSSGMNYFDRKDFDSNHAYGIVQGEW